MNSPEPILLDALDADQVPAALQTGSYFDWQAHPFAHEALFDGCNSVCAAVQNIKAYAQVWLNEADPDVAQDVEPGAFYATENCAVYNTGNKQHQLMIEPGARVIDVHFDVSGGDIYIGHDTTIEPGVLIKGPTIIGQDCELRKSAYLRGNCIVGDGCVLGGELKNVVLMDGGNYPHPSYIGDSLCGYASHFGNQATAANLGIFQGLQTAGKYEALIVTCDGKRYQTGSAKLGVCLGDYSQVGCNAVLDPGTFLMPRTVVYSLSRINSGFYGPNEILKNKPMEHGIIERTPLNV